jgi:hypothetical protein
MNFGWIATLLCITIRYAIISQQSGTELRVPVSGPVGGLIELRHSWAIKSIIEIASESDISRKYEDGISIFQP